MARKALLLQRLNVDGPRTAFKWQAPFRMTEIVVDPAFVVPVPTEKSVLVVPVDVTANHGYASRAMTSVLLSVLLTLRSSAPSRAALHLEVLALRHQLQVLQRSRPRALGLGQADRWLWTWLSRVWTAWRTALVIVKPETVIAWHRRGFRLLWTWKSRRRTGRPTVPADLRALIRTMSETNPRWGASRIHGELLKLGIDISQATVAKYMVRRRRPPSQTWRTFLENHFGQVMAADFFMVPTATSRLLFVLVILAHERRRVMHVAVTDHPTATGTAQQLREAFPWDRAPRYLVRDRDHAFDGLSSPQRQWGFRNGLGRRAHPGKTTLVISKSGPGPFLQPNQTRTTRFPNPVGDPKFAEIQLLVGTGVSAR